MNRARNEQNKSKGFYIAVCCCVLVIAIIGYVSWFAKNTAPVPQNDTNSLQGEVYDVPNLSEISKISVEEEERKTVPVEEKTAPVAKNVITEDNIPEFSKPVDGKVLEDFSGDDLIFYEKLSDWRTHDGVDFKAKVGTDVLASAGGVVESVYSDNMGNCVVIDHENGVKSIYANLESSDPSLIGKNVNAGDKIGTVGNSALADLSEEPHLHFEIYKDDRPVNPMDYLEK